MLLVLWFKFNIHIYVERYPNRVIPHHTIVAHLHQSTTETRSILNERSRLYEIHETEDYPTTNTRNITANLNIIQSMVFLEKSAFVSITYPTGLGTFSCEFPQRLSLYTGTKF